MKRSYIFLIALAAALGVSSTRLQAQGFVVIVNASNARSGAAMTKLQVADLLLKRVPKWNGEEPMPVDYDDDAVRETFSKSVLGKPTTAVKAYWQQQLFGGKKVPPPAMASEADVIKFVASNPAAIGYVSPNAPLTSGVRAVKVQ